jgi:hypothetical protein
VILSPTGEKLEGFMIASVVGLVAVVIGGVIGFVALFVHWWERQQAQARARAMTLAYVNGVLQMEERRWHGERSQLALAALKAGASVTLPKIFVTETYPNFDEVQKAVIGQLRQLAPDDARDMVMFLNMCLGLDADEVAMSAGKMDDCTPQQKIAILEGDVKLRKEMLELGRKLVRRLGPG